MSEPPCPGADPSELAALIAAIEDPELPHLTIGDLGIVRAVELVDGGRARVVLTPTFTGCPAAAQISRDVADVLRRAGYEPDVVMQLAPAWSTDWITPVGRRKLARAGIAPPPGGASGGDLDILLDLPVACPQCGSRRTSRQSEFGSTACKVPYVCLACREPFEGFKPL